MNRCASQRRAPERGSGTNSVRHEKRRGRFSLSPREERAWREVERGETDEKRPPLPDPLLLFWGGEGEGNRCCGPSKLLAEHSRPRECFSRRCKLRRCFLASS